MDAVRGATGRESAVTFLEEGMMAGGGDEGGEVDPMEVPPPSLS